ncbi:MAG: hypothetical protein ACOYLI_00080 [Synechococcus lacustris]
MNRDHKFLAACGRLASLLNLSIGAARQRIDHQIAQKGANNPASKFAVVEGMLAAAQLDSAAHSELLDNQLEALESEANFLVED